VTTTLPPTIIGAFGRQRPILDVLHNSIKHATTSAPISDATTSMIADRIIHDIIRAYTIAHISGQSYAIIPLAYTSDPPSIGTAA